MDARSRDQMRNRRMKRNKDIPAGMKTDGVISIRDVSKTAEDPSAIDYDWERCRNRVKEGPKLMDLMGRAMMACTLYIDTGATGTLNFGMR